MSENIITCVSFDLWTAPKLMDVNLSHNGIKKVASYPTSGFTTSMRRRNLTAQVCTSQTS